MKIVVVPEVSDQNLIVSDMLTIELRQVGEAYLEIRLVPHYEDRVFLNVHDMEGHSKIIHLPEANSVILNYILDNKMGKV